MTPDIHVWWQRLCQQVKCVWRKHLRARHEEDVDIHSVEDGEEALDLGLGAEAGLLYNGCSPTTVISPPQHQPIQLNLEHKLGHRGENLVREPSIQSDVTSHGSHGSSVESFLESRKPDPEEVLLSLGFGGSTSVDSEVSRIPRRFLQPSKVKGVAIDDFLKYQQDLIETFETGFCGYRGLTGSTATGFSSTHIVSSASSPVRTFAPLSPVFSDNLVNIPPRFVPQRQHVPRKLLSVPGGSCSPLVRTLSSRRHLSVSRQSQDRRASEPNPAKV